MMQQHMEIKKHIEATSHMEVHYHFLTIEEIKAVKELLPCLTAPESVATELQDEATGLLDACNLFNGLIENYPGLRNRRFANFFITEDLALERLFVRFETEKSFSEPHRAVSNPSFARKHLRAGL